jgi:uncharacterized protein (DUF58 family)
VTRRGRFALLFGAAAYLAAWAFGSKALYPLAACLVVAPLAAWAWMALASRPVSLRRVTRGREHFEGDDVEVEVRLELGRGLPPAAVVLQESISKLGERTTRLRGGRARYLLEQLPRGRYEVEGAAAVLEDPFGLARTEVELSVRSPVLVYPRLVRLQQLFSDLGSTLPEGRRILMHRPSGFDLHSVREHQQGESLRRVHWRSTAKRGRLMVRELEDAPRDEVAVLLDAQAGTAGGDAFDTAVRVAGSLLLAHTSRNRRAVLVVNGRTTESVQAGASEGDRRRVLELLAAAEPDGERPAAVLLSGEGSPVLHALELVVVTAALTPLLVERIVQRRHARRHVSLVYVDGRRDREPGLLRLQAAGIAVAVVQPGDDLSYALGGRVVAEAIGG